MKTNEIFNKIAQIFNENDRIEMDLEMDPAGFLNVEIRRKTEYFELSKETIISKGRSLLVIWIYPEDFDREAKLILGRSMKDELRVANSTFKTLGRGFFRRLERLSEYCNYITHGTLELPNGGN